MDRPFLMTLIGIALMAWGGQSITSGLEFTGWRQANVALFALGIIIVAQAPMLSLRVRIRELEKTTGRSLGDAGSAS